MVGFIRTAAEDPNVLSIKQTLYRTSENSPIVRALIEAAAKKEVTVVVEVKARFDEASNIRWARSLEDAGVQVFHGLVGLKTHCKLALMVRKDPDNETRLYAHLGTGNYNSITATYYTDLSLLTADPEITSAVHGVFNFLTAYAERPSYNPLLVAPIDLAERCINLIAREADHARHGRPARIIAKMNSLLDRNIVRELYRASQAGVQIDLIVRGICGLRPGVRGVSDHIKRAQHCGTIPGTQPDLLLCQRRRRGNLSGQRRLDAAQPARAGGNAVSHQRPDAETAHSRRNSGGLSGR